MFFSCACVRARTCVRHSNWLRRPPVSNRRVESRTDRRSDGLRLHQVFVDLSSVLVVVHAVVQVLLIVHSLLTAAHTHTHNLFTSSFQSTRSMGKEQAGGEKPSSRQVFDVGKWKMIKCAKMHNLSPNISQVIAFNISSARVQPFINQRFASFSFLFFSSLHCI